MSRRPDRHRPVRWLWASHRLDARIVRLILLPISLVWWVVLKLRARGYQSGIIPSSPLPLPSVSIGNLTVGGSGKTPLTGWVARHFASSGLKPGVLLRGVGGDETQELREAVPGAIVAPNPDRIAGAAAALAQGAEVLVLDDAYQRLDTRRDCNICVISTESTQAVPWPLPAGPWREGLGALDRADALIISRKRAGAEQAGALAEKLRSRIRGPVAVVCLQPARLTGLLSKRESSLEVLRGRRVVAVCAIADPQSFVRQLKQAGALVQLESWQDHHAFDQEDIAWLIHAMDRADFVVMTAKDAVKVRPHWPESAPEPLVAQLDISFDSGEAALRDLLDRTVAHLRPASHQ